MDEGNSTDRKAKIIKFPGKKQQSPDTRVYELVIYRGYGSDYHLAFIGKGSDHYKQLYDGPRLSKLAKSLVDDLPSLDTPFSINVAPRAYLYYEPDFSIVHSPPSDRELKRIHRLTDRELRKRKDGWRGLKMHYEFRLADALDALQGRYFPNLGDGVNKIFGLVFDEMGNPKRKKKGDDKGIKL